MTASIVGAGIGGLVAAMSLHDAGFEVDVYESVPEVRALGLGINLLPHAVRELDALGLLDRLAAQSVAPDTLAYSTKRGQQIWSETRGLAMYPIGSNGASQAILDARTLAGCLRSRPDDADAALARYDEVRWPATSAIVLANRGLGPELPVQLVEERAPDGFEHIEDVITSDEIAAVTDGYRRTAGFALAAMAVDARSLADREW